MILLLHEDPIEAFVPRFVFAILFGLSTGDEVFVTSRIREEHVHGLKTRRAVEHGIAVSGPAVVAASGNPIELFQPA